MKTKSILIAALFAVAALVSPSCSKEGDTTKPSIELIEPEDGEEFKPGSTICVEMNLSDDTALESFKINIHNAFDGHGHGTKHGAEDDHYNTDTANAFSYTKTSEELGESVKGLKNAHRHIHVDIPSTASCGDYHLMVYCNDAEGNESYVARSIAISEDAEEHDHDHE